MWLKGDLHSHSRYSDGDSSVKDVLEEAKNRAGLQFASITDHDTHFRDHPSRITTWYDPAHEPGHLSPFLRTHPGRTAKPLSAVLVDNAGLAVL